MAIRSSSLGKDNIGRDTRIEFLKMYVMSSKWCAIFENTSTLVYKVSVCWL